jgi:predicted nucleotidyltransferase
MPDDSRRWEQIIERTRSLLLGQPSVQSVELVGSRLHGTATELSDIDLLVDTDDFELLAAALPRLLDSLEPLAAQWDRLSEEATYYMLVLPGAIKLDLVFDRPPRLEPPWEVSRSTLAGIDAHFWDWILWLGGKQLAGNDGLVELQLGVVMYDHLLRPLGVAPAPSSIAGAVDAYLGARGEWEQRLGTPVGMALQDAVHARLRAAGVIEEGTL